MPPAALPPHNIPVHHLNGTNNQLEAGSSCHQCKSRRAYYELIYCTQQQRKKKGNIPTAPVGCRKKYCEHCLLKFYQEARPSEQALKSWTCPSCRHECSCAACRKKGDDAPGHWNPSGGDGRLREDRRTSSSSRQAAAAAAATYHEPSYTSNYNKRSSRHRAPPQTIDYDDYSANNITVSSGRTTATSAAAAASAAALANANHNGNNDFQNNPNMISQPLSPGTSSTSITPHVHIQHLDGTGVNNNINTNNMNGNSNNNINGVMGPNSNTNDVNGSLSPHIASSTQFSFTTTAAGLQSPPQHPNQLHSHQFLDHHGQHQRPPLFSTAHHLNQLKVQSLQQQPHQQPPHPQQVNSTHSQSQQGPNGHQQPLQSPPQQQNNLQNNAVSAQISPHLQPLFRPVAKSPTLLPANSGPLSLKGSPPFNAVSLGNKALGGTNATPNLSQFTNKLNALFEPGPNPLLSSLINRTNAAGGTAVAGSQGGPGTNQNSTNTTQVHSPKNGALRTAAIGVASPQFQAAPLDSNSNTNAAVGGSPQMGPNNGGHQNNSNNNNNGNNNNNNNTNNNNNNNNNANPQQTDFHLFTSPLIQGVTPHFTQFANGQPPQQGQNHHQQLAQMNQITQIAGKKVQNDPNDTTAQSTLLQQQQQQQLQQQQNALKTLSSYNPPSSLFMPQMAPNLAQSGHNGHNSHLFNVATAARLLPNLSKDVLSLSTNPSSGSVSININGQHLLSLNGTNGPNGQLTNFNPATLNEANGLLQARTNMLNAMGGIPDLSANAPQSPSVHALSSPMGMIGMGQKLQTFATLHPSQQTQVLATTILEILQKENIDLTQQLLATVNIDGKSSGEGFGGIEHNNSTSTTTSTIDSSITSTPVAPTPTHQQHVDENGNVVSLGAAGTPSPDTSDENSVETNMSELSYLELKQSLDTKLEQLQLEHQTLLGLIDKTTHKLSKNGNKNEKNEYIELIKHLTTGLKRVQTEISNVQYRVQMYAVKRPVMIANETVLALFALLWTIAHSPNVHSQLTEINGQNQSFVNKVAKIHALFLTNISQTHQRQMQQQQLQQLQQQQQLLQTGVNQQYLQDGNNNTMMMIDEGTNSISAHHPTTLSTSSSNDGNGSNTNQNSLSGLGIDLLTAHNFATFSLGQSKVQQTQSTTNNNTNPTRQAFTTSGFVPIVNNSGQATATGTMALQQQQQQQQQQLQQSSSSHDGPVGVTKRKATSDMDQDILDLHTTAPISPGLQTHRQ